MLAANDVNAHLIELMWLYAFLSTIFGCFLIYALRQKMVVCNWRKLLKISVASVTETQGHFLMILSYSYTSLVMVAALSYFINGRRYTVVQYIGLATCLCGVAVLMADLQVAHWEFGGTVESNLMTLAAAFLYTL